MSDDRDSYRTKNFLSILCSNTLTKVGDRLSNPKITLTWLMQALGVPVFFTSIIVPLREAGSMLPQIFLSGFIQQFAYRKKFWISGSMVQGFSILGIAGCSFIMEGSAAGWMIIFFLSLFSLARCFCSIVSKDILGKTIAKGKRGNLKGWMGMASGIISILAGCVMIYLFQEEQSRSSISSLSIYLGLAGSLWLGAAFIYSFINEPSGDKEKDSGSFVESLAQFGVFKTDVNFRNFTITRALAMGSSLSAPFVITMASRELGGSLLWLGLFTVVDGLASSVSSLAWGRLADKSSKRVLQLALFLTGLLLGTIVIIDYYTIEGSFLSQWLFPLYIFLLGVIHSGVRIGRKTYLVDMAEGNKRTSYVTTGNTAIGCILLLNGGLSGVLASFSVSYALVLLGSFSLLGLFMTKKLPDVS